MLRVMVVCEYPSLNGGERSLLEAVRRIDREEFEILVAAPRAGRLAEVVMQVGLQHVAFDVRDAQGGRYPRLDLRRRLERLIRQRRPDVLHANSVSMARLCGPVVAHLGTPSIGHLRDVIRLSAASIHDLNCHRRLLAVSHATQDWYVAAGVDADRTFVTYNGVDLVRFQPCASTGYLRGELSLPPAARLVATIGQIGMRKGLDVLVEAAAALARRWADVHFVIVGQRYSQKDEAREFERRLLRASGTAPLAGRVHFMGLRQDVDRLMNELTLYLHAARQEPLGRVLLEAAASGLPIVATDVGGTSEIFPPRSEAAILVPADSPTALAEAAAQLLASPARCRSLAHNARRRAESFFDIASAANRLANHYRQVATPPAGNVT